MKRQRCCLAGWLLLCPPQLELRWSGQTATSHGAGGLPCNAFGESVTLTATVAGGR